MGTVSQSPVPALKTFKQFLESTPPETYEDVSDALERAGNAYPVQWRLFTPDLFLHCASEGCGGDRFYRRTESTVYTGDKGWYRGFLTYRCRNCDESVKFYALTVLVADGPKARVYKYGEVPVFGPPVPARVISLIGPDRDFFLLGRRAENHGLGIGAFAYYRRVVENQKGRIIREIAKVAKKLGASAEVLKDFEKAAGETQFKTAIDDIKAGLPTVLLIDSHNPLTLLHGALSDGLHAQDDATCLELSHSIRIVLTELAERISSVLKEQQELQSAVSKLLNRKTPESSEIPKAETTE